MHYRRPIHSYLVPVTLHSTLAVGEGSKSCSHATQLFSLVIGEEIHSLNTDIETTGRGINSNDFNGLALVLQGVAFAAVRIVPFGDGGCATDAGECRQGVESSKSLGHEAVLAVGAGDFVQGGASNIIFGIVGDRDLCSGSGSGSLGLRSWSCTGEVEGGHEGDSDSSEGLHCGIYREIVF